MKMVLTYAHGHGRPYRFYGNAYPCKNYAVTISREPDRIAVAIQFTDLMYTIGAKPRIYGDNDSTPTVTGGRIELAPEPARQLANALLEASDSAEGNSISYQVGEPLEPDEE